MTSLDIIKYLATNNPTRLAELLDDIYCTAWNCGSCAGSTGKIMEECEIDDFNEWLHQDASKSGFYYDEELEEWSKLMREKENLMEYINKPVTTDARNRMGCSENWYNPYYAIKQTFSLEEIQSMSNKEIENLVRLADEIGMGLY